MLLIQTKMKKAQSIIEYALLIAVATVALMAMQAYFKRGVQSVVKVSADQLGGFNSGVSADTVQQIAIRQELDPKYGALKGHKTQITTDQSVTVTTLPNAEGATNMVINKWEEGVKDLPYAANVHGQTVPGKVFYQQSRD